MNNTIGALTLLEYINEELEHGIEFISLGEILDLIQSKGF